MTGNHWEQLVRLIDGEHLSAPLTGFIIDSPWLPGWHGISNLEYYTSEELWFEANYKAVSTFPECIFIPGFWSEFGMCTEPSAFGSKLMWSQDSLPHAERIIDDLNDINSLKRPNVKTDGLLPFVIERLKRKEKNILKKGHEIKFAVTRGPLNIAAFLMGTTEFMIHIASAPDHVHRLLRLISDFISDWIELQKETFPSIDGILILDDLVGFLGEAELKEFALPYLKDIFTKFEFKARFFHNDAHGLVCAPFLAEAGVNMFNFSFEHSINEMVELTGEKVVLAGNLPPRDVLAAGTPEEVYRDTCKMYNTTINKDRILWSCGGGMPQDVSTENIKSFIRAINECHSQ